MEIEIQPEAPKEPEKTIRTTKFAVINIDKLILDSKHDTYESAVEASLNAVFPSHVREMFKKSKTTPKMRSFFIAKVYEN